MAFRHLLSVAVACCGVSVGDASAHPYAPGSVEVTGFLVDLECYFLNLRGLPGVDGSNVITNPGAHRVHCLKDLPQCRAYYIAMNLGTSTAPNYQPRFVLDTPGNLDALALLESIDEAVQPDNVKVTVKGMHQGDGLITMANITLCSAGECDGTCTGDSDDCAAMWTTDGTDVVMYTGHAIDLGLSSEPSVGLAWSNTDITGSLAEEVKCAKTSTMCQAFVLADWKSSSYHPKYALDAWGNVNTLALMKTASSVVESVTVFAKAVGGGLLGGVSVQRCAAGADCAGMCHGSMCATMWSPTVRYSGYIIDDACYVNVSQGLPAFDGSDVIKAPWDHKVGCMTGPPVCITYYLAENVGTTEAPNYQPKYSLDAVGNLQAWNLMMQSDKTNDYMVTVWGQDAMMNGKTVLQYASIRECMGSSCVSAEAVTAVDGAAASNPWFSIVLLGLATACASMVRF